jgi:two-component system response regulator YesN
MYTALIVDDEQWSLKGIVNTFSLESYNIQIICSTLSSVKALQILIEQKPDVVVTDIMMADITGLDLMKFAKIYGIESEFILVSGYNNFEYAKKAIDFGAFSYILKPFDKVEIRRTIKKLKERLDTIKEIKSHFINTSRKQNEKVDKFLAGNGENYFRCIALNVSDYQYLLNLKVPENVLCLKHKDNHYYITQEHFHEVFIQQILNLQLLKVSLKLRIGISNKFQNKEKINIMMSQALSAQMNYILYENKCLFYYKDMKIQNVIEISNNIIDFIKDYNFEGLDYFLNKEMLHKLREKNMTIKDFTFLYNMVINYIDEDGDKANNDCNIKYCASEKELFNDPNISTLISEFYSLIISIYYCDSKNISTNPVHPTLNKILFYIEENYDQQLSLDLLSEEFSINRTYICDLFKKYTGETLTQYINKIKMSKARKLINETAYTLKQVANEVGYNEYPYFARVFKKYYGKSPSRIRKS